MQLQARGSTITKNIGERYKTYCFTLHLRYYFFYVIYYGEDIPHWMCVIYCIIIHQTHYEKSDWPRAFNQFTIACELDMINVISAADITFIMSSSTSVWLLSPLEYSPQKQNG